MRVYRGLQEFIGVYRGLGYSKAQRDTRTFQGRLLGFRVWGLGFITAIAIIITKHSYVTTELSRIILRTINNGRAQRATRTLQGLQLRVQGSGFKVTDTTLSTNHSDAKKKQTHGCSEPLELQLQQNRKLSAEEHPAVEDWIPRVWAFGFWGCWGLGVGCVSHASSASYKLERGVHKGLNCDDTLSEPLPGDHSLPLDEVTYTTSSFEGHWLSE